VLGLAVPQQHRTHPNQPPIRPVSMPANASIGAPALTLGVIVRRTGSSLNARRQPIPHSARGSLGCPISRPDTCGEAIVAGIRNPSQQRKCGASFDHLIGAQRGTSRQKVNTANVNYAGTLLGSDCAIVSIMLPAKPRWMWIAAMEDLT
jgi:hypothetical protein